jgi:hypothetical protein
MEATHEPLYLDKWDLVQQKITDTPTSFTCIIVLFDEAIKYGDDAKLWGCVDINAE